MDRKSTIQRAIVGLLTWLVLLACAATAYAAGEKNFTARKDGTGLYDQMRAYYAPYESSEYEIGFRLWANKLQVAEFWGDSTDLELVNGQNYTVEMALGYRGPGGQMQTGSYNEQGTMNVSLYCDADITVTGLPDAEVLLNGSPAKGYTQVFDHTDAVLEVPDAAGYACEVLVNGTPIRPATEAGQAYHLGELDAQTEIKVQYFRTNVHCATPANGTVSLTNEADGFAVQVTPDAGYAVAAIRVNGAVQTGTTYQDGGVALLTLENDGKEDYIVSVDIVKEQIAAKPSPVLVCRAGWEDALTKEQIFAAAVDAAASVPANLTVNDVEVEYQSGGAGVWAVLGDAHAAHKLGEQAQEVVRFVYPGSADGQYPAFTSGEIMLSIEREERDIWLEQPAHASMASEETADGDFLVTVVPDEGYAVQEITVAEGRDAAAVWQDVTFENGMAHLTLPRKAGTSYTVAAKTVKQELALLNMPVLVFREGQDYTEAELREMIFAVTVDTAQSVPSAVTAQDVEIRYLAQPGAMAAGGERLDYQPTEGGGHVFGEQDTEHIYIVYNGSPSGQYRAMTQELDLTLQRTRLFKIQIEQYGAAPEQGGAVLFAVRGGESHVIEDGVIWEDGETVVLSVTPIVGYAYEVTVNGDVLPGRPDDTYTLGVVQEDIRIELHYRPVNMTVEDAGHSVFTIGIPDAEGIFTVQAEPEEGYAVTAILLNGEPMQSLFYRDGTAFATLTPQQALLECRFTVETVKEELAVRNTDLSGYETVPPAELKTILLKDVLDTETCVPSIEPDDIEVEYCAAVEVPELNWSGELWLPVEAGPQEVLEKLPAQIAGQLGDGAEGIRFLRFGRQASERLRILYRGGVAYRPFAQEITVQMPDYRAETEIKLKETSLSVDYGCTEEELKTQLLALVEALTAEGEAVAYAPEELTVEAGDGLTSPGTHTAHIIYKGNEAFKNASAPVTVTVAAGAATVSLRVEDVVTYGERYDIRVRTSSEDLCYALVVACTKGDKKGYICITLSDTAKVQMQVQLPGREGITDLYKTAFTPALEGSTLTEAIESLEEFDQKYGEYLPGLQLNNIIELLEQVKTKIPLSQCRVCLDDTFTQTGDYFVGVITVDANYNTAKDTANMTIQRSGSGVSLEWNNQGKTFQILSRSQAARTDFGATLYDANVRTTNNAVKNSVVTLCAGVTFDKQPFVSSVGPEDAGVYLQAAFVVNPDYASQKLFRAIVILNT